MIDVGDEVPLSFQAISKRYPAHPSVPTLWRWALYGLKGVKLETIKIGGRRYTSFEAIDRFAARLTELQPSDGLSSLKRRRQEMIRTSEQAAAIFGERSRK